MRQKPWEVYGWDDLLKVMKKERKYYSDKSLGYGVYFWIGVIITAINLIKKEVKK